MITVINGQHSARNTMGHKHDGNTGISGASEQVRLARLKPDQYLARFIFLNKKFCSTFPHIAILIRGSEKPDQSVTASDAPGYSRITLNQLPINYMS